MNRFDRLLGIVLELRSRKVVPASKLAKSFGVSRRTIYRDIETLSLLGVPVYSERGRGGGIHLLEGYFLPPLMFSTKEAASLLLGLTFLHKLNHIPFAEELATAEQKLLAAMPGRLQKFMWDASQIINFEELSEDIFHPEPQDETPGEGPESHILSRYLEALLDDKLVRLRYKSPYSQQVTKVKAMPMGMFWDRNRWYLVGSPFGQEESIRLWRADRVVRIQLGREEVSRQPSFDIQTLLGHNWLDRAMAAWRQEAPVKIQLTTEQARRLQKDWYYRHARFEVQQDGRVVMIFGEDNQSLVLALLRWLGPGAVLLEPETWRQQLVEELQQLLAVYKNDDPGSIPFH